MHRQQNFFRSLLLTGSLLATGAVSAFAQSPTGSIAGTVTDASGAIVPNAKVVIKNQDTGQTQNLTSDGGGRYVAPQLTPGQYSVQVTAAGFTPSQQDNITINVQETHPVDIKLSVGSDTQAVTVQSTTPELQTSSATTGEVITGKRIRDLPLNGRDPFDLAELVPGVNNVGTGPGSSSTPHIAGSRSANSEEQLDGITNITPENNVGNNSGAYTPIVDSVEEFNVQTSVLPAEYGRFSGGVINLATRTGTNKFHGSLFEFNRNSIFDARDYFSSPTSPIPPLSRNQAGGTLGGPLIKNRTFFFVAAEISREVDSSTETDSVATAAERTGDFSALLAQGTQLYNPRTAHPGTYTNSKGQVVTGGTVRDPYPGNIIPQADFSAAGVAALKYQPLPTGPGLLNNYVVTAGAPTTNYYHYDIRVDHNWTQAWHTFVRFSHVHSDYIPFADYPANNGIASQGYNGPSTSGAYSLAYDNTFTISPTLLFDVRYGLSRSSYLRTPFGGNFDITQVGLPASLAATSNYLTFPSYSIGNGYSSIGGGGFVPLLQNPTVHDGLANFTKVKGGHEMRFGGEFRKLFLNFHQYGYPSGQFGFSQSWTQQAINDNTSGGGNPFASLLLGLPDYGNYSIDPTFAASSNYFALYGEDTWRATPHFTLSYGLRWDMDQPRTERHNQLSYWNPNDVSPINAQIAPSANCPACGNLRGSMHFTGTASGQFGRQQINAHKLDFGPRFGAIWSPNPNWAVRAGFGIVFAPSDVQPAGSDGGAGTQGFNTNTNAPFTFNNQATINTTLDNPYPTGLLLPAGAKAGPGTDLGNTIQQSFLTNNDTRTPYSEQANLTIQRTLPGSTVVEIGWLYNQGKFLVVGDPGTPFDQVNPSYLSLGSALTQQVANPFYGIITTPGSSLAQPTVQRNQLLRPFPQYNGVTEYRKDTAYSNYNAITARLDKRFAQGLTLLVAYTGAKLFDNSASPVTFLGPTSNTYNNQYNPRGEYSVSPQDISHDLVASYTYELPFGPGRHFLSNTHGIVSTLLSGFQTSGIVNYIGGTPIVVNGVSSNNTGLLGEGQRPNMSNYNAKLSNPTRNEWFNTALFSDPAPYTLGNAPRTLANVRTPRLVSADLSAIKNNYFGADQHYNLQLRLEAFNAFNHVQLGAPDSAVDDGGNFGKITGTANGPRQVQLAAKFNF
jgi:hypothetical protein